MKILVVNPRLAERIRGYLPEDIDVLSPEVGNDEELIELAGDVEVILATRLSSEVALAAPRLRLLQKTGAGVDDLPFAQYGQYDPRRIIPVELAEYVVRSVLGSRHPSGGDEQQNQEVGGAEFHLRTPGWCSW